MEGTLRIYAIILITSTWIYAVQSTHHQRLLKILRHQCHKLTLLKEKIEFSCDAKCEEIGYGFPYKCLQCGLTFHIDCVWHPSEVKHQLEVKNHSCHSLHPLKLILTGQVPDYSDGKCHLCEKKIDSPLFYHCPPCA